MAFPMLGDGVPFVAVADEANGWSGAKHIAFRQVTNAFCNTRPGQDEASLYALFEAEGGRVGPTLRRLVDNGRTSRRQCNRA